MNRKLLLLGCMLGLTVVFSSCGKKNASNAGSDDQQNDQGLNSDSMAAVRNSPDNNSSTVKIGDQEWMKENLNISSFRNGDLIPEAKTDEAWAQASREGKPAWCNYGNNPNIGGMYGKLYNWFAVADPRGLAPEGWHVPSAEEWDQMVAVFGSGAGTKLRSTAAWDEDKNGTNESGFNGLPGGFRYSDGHAFLLFYVYGVWWTTTESEDTDDQAEARHLAIFNPEMLWRSDSPDEVGRFYAEKGYGFSVRCISDSGNMGRAPKNQDEEPAETSSQGEGGEDQEVQSMLNLLQGKWQHTEDASNYLVFEGKLKKEISEGLEEWKSEEFILSDRCMNERDKGGYTTGEKGMYISVMKSNMCWYIEELDESNLSLSYVGRGNTLTYKKVN